MLQPETFHFLRQLRDNNDKVWFDTHKMHYLAAKADVENMVRTTLRIVGSIDNTLGHLLPKDCMFRIYRDVRFSPNKVPYKTNMGFWLSRGNKKSPYAGYYFHIEPDASFFGGGLYMPEPTELKKVRQEIAYCFDEFREVVETPAFSSFYGGVVIEGHSLAKPPADYALHPAANYLKLKSFFATRSLTDAALCSPSVEETLEEGIRLAAPLVHFLNRPLLDD